jgi:hypothetical protein
MEWENLSLLDSYTFVTLVPGTGNSVFLRFLKIFGGLCVYKAPPPQLHPFL